jgi:hypothetical protein
MEEMTHLQAKIQSLDPLGADAVFSQLPAYNAHREIIVATQSLITTNCFKPKTRNPPLVWVYQAHPEGFEPPTLGSEDRCSNPLSYGCITIIIP